MGIYERDRGKSKTNRVLMLLQGEMTLGTKNRA